MSTTRKRERDPIFALIAAHAKAAKASDKATAALRRLQERLDKRKDQQRRNPQRRLTCTVPLFDIGPKYDPLIVIKDRAHIKGEIWRAFDRIRQSVGPRAGRAIMKHEKEAVAEMQRRYDAFQAAHRRARRAVGLQQATQREWSAEAVAVRALNALCRAQPTTDEGRRALAQHLAKLTPVSAPWWALHMALARLAE